MNCSNQRSGNDRKTYHKNYYAKNREQILARKKKNDIVPRTLRFSNHVVKGGMKTTGKGLPAAREPIVNKTRNTSEITEANTVKTTDKIFIHLRKIIKETRQETKRLDLQFPTYINLLCIYKIK